MEIYTEVITLKITKTQKETLNKLKSKKVKISNFIRLAIKEKLEREKHEILRTKQHCPFSGQEIK